MNIQKKLSVKHQKRDFFSTEFRRMLDYYIQKDSRKSVSLSSYE